MIHTSDFIECDKLYIDCDKAMNEFFLWLKNNEGVSEYEKDHIITEISMGCLVSDVKWHIIKGLLYEFFDLNGLHIEPHSVKGESKFGFIYYIRTYFDKDGYVWSGSGDGLQETRSKAEANGFTKAFEMLERKICR